jgi:hypothetical protein
MLRKILAGAAAAVALLATAGNLPAQAAPAQAVPIMAPALQNEPVPPTVSATAAKQRGPSKAQEKVSEPWKFQDKGFPDRSGKFKIPAKSKEYAKNPNLTPVMPLPPSGSTVYRMYNIVKEDLVAGNVGVALDMTIAAPYMNYGSEYHGIMEVSLQDANGNVVEVGWTRNPQVCSGQTTATAPCLFVFSWETGDGQCYNGCGFIPTAGGSTYTIGGLLPNPNNSSGLNFRLLKTATDIFVGVGDPADPKYWVGRWPLSLWDVSVDPTSDATAPFGQPTLTQAFTETASVEPVSPTYGTTTPCSDAGNGYEATSPNGGANAARILNYKVLTGTGSTSVFASPSWENQPSTIPVGASGVFPMQTPATYNFRVGGPLFRSNNTVPGVRGGCGT